MSQGGVFEFLREAALDTEGEGSQEAGPSFKSDLLEHHNLRALYDNLVETKWQPPRKVGKAEYFVYSTIAGDGHLRSDVGEAGASKYDLAPVAEVRKATEEVKLRPLGSNMIKEAFPLEPGHFELPKIEIGVAIHKRDKKDRGKKLASAAETRSIHSNRTTELETHMS
ncbi:hypothetical protein HOP50_08g52820 [Chloropicon primus]|uniref:Uncharacterized protein n=1 Tax=Chloropicon primus TaxID=1764295 RepID=A0A5B8MS51_9CHLO|nr:hypothetical protein A3770_08p52520 [Chloropicon primus]UPR01958.1 hypothetical protein HOP50_08g52820 [Chloropicon primus]|mmetsp:Transcript_785/g.1648  ORF Transcript_785/g.1648 Transcript_785/m.1648 type:complete len:168 (+) Transcript_785:170-673(+)|eukprot:QDZ22734.1 hypothetical protein A3770_08p52520 [Chloropicon primus]